MKLFVLRQKRFSYDTVQSVLVWAEDAKQARRIAQAGAPKDYYVAEHTARNTSEVSWAPKDAYCNEVHLNAGPKIVHTHFAAG